MITQISEHLSTLNITKNGSTDAIPAFQSAFNALKLAGGANANGVGDEGGGTAYSQYGDKINTIDDLRGNRQPQTVKTELTVNIKSRDSHIVEVVKNNVETRGTLHETFVKFADA